MLEGVTKNIVGESSQLDWLMLVIIVMLLFVGILMNQMATSNQIDPSRLSIDKSENKVNFSEFYSKARSQIFKVLIGMLFGLFCFSIKPSFWRNKKVYYGLLISSFILLIAVLKWGVTLNGATRWFSIYGVSFAPADFARFALIIFTANYLHEHIGKISKLKVSFYLLLVLFAIIVPIMKQPNLSTVIVFCGIVGSMMWLAGIPKKWAVIALVVLSIGALFVSMNSFRGIRLKVWTDPVAWYNRTEEIEKTNPQLADKIESVAFHQVQSLIAISQGGFTGVGGGNSMQKYFLPEAYSDSIISIIGEEWGFLGVLFVVSLYATFIYRGFSVIARSRDTFKQQLAFGIVINFAIYFLIHFYINIAAMPATGLPLPFISHGGTAMIFNIGLLGILLRLSTEKGPLLHSESN